MKKKNVSKNNKQPHTGRGDGGDTQVVVVVVVEANLAGKKGAFPGECAVIPGIPPLLAGAGAPDPEFHSGVAAAHLQ